MVAFWLVRIGRRVNVQMVMIAMESIAMRTLGYPRNAINPVPLIMMNFGSSRRR